MEGRELGVGVPSCLTSLGEAGNPGSIYNRVQLCLERSRGGPTGMPLSLKDQNPSPCSALPLLCDLGGVLAPLWSSIPIWTVRLSIAKWPRILQPEILFSSLSSLPPISPSLDACLIRDGLRHRELWHCWVLAGFAHLGTVTWPPSLLHPSVWLDVVLLGHLWLLPLDFLPDPFPSPWLEDKCHVGELRDIGNPMTTFMQGII